MLPHRLRSDGFSVTELVFVIVGIGIMATLIFSFFSGSINQYFKLQADSYAFSEISTNSQRIARVLRGSYTITDAQADTVTMYSYFAPQETYTSVIKYYLSNDQKKLMADVRAMTANPPIGVPTGPTKTVTVMNSFYKAPGVSTFEYLDLTGSVLTPPISDLNNIKSIRIQLSTKPYDSASSNVTSTNLTVNLRNRKTNL